MATAYSIGRRLARIEYTRRRAQQAREQAAEGDRLLRYGDPISRRWGWVDPDDSSEITMTWVPEMGSWQALMSLLDAGEDVAHGLTRRDRNGEPLTLDRINRAIVARVNCASHVTGMVVAWRPEETM